MEGRGDAASSLANSVLLAGSLAFLYCGAGPFARWLGGLALLAWLTGLATARGAAGGRGARRFPPVPGGAAYGGVGRRRGAVRGLQVREARCRRSSRTRGSRFPNCWCPWGCRSWSATPSPTWSTSTGARRRPQANLVTRLGSYPALVSPAVRRAAGRGTARRRGRSSSSGGPRWPRSPTGCGAGWWGSGRWRSWPPPWRGRRTPRSRCRPARSGATHRVARRGVLRAAGLLQPVRLRRHGHRVRARMFGFRLAENFPLAVPGPTR